MKILSKLDNTGMIEEVEDKRYVTDAEKLAWNGKADKTYVDSQDALKADKTAVEASLELKADKSYVDSELAVKVDNSRVLTDVPANAKFTDTNTTYSEISTAEIDAGTASTLRTITGRRVKYILDKVQGWINGVTKSDVGLGNVDNIKQMPISGGVLENYREKLVSTSGGGINLSLGNVFQYTPSGNTTFSFLNAVNGQAHSFTLIINMGSTVRTLTFPASVKWQGEEIPDMSTANKTYVLTFMTVDGGSNWLGMFGGEF